jgi:hypothetical protein
MLLSYVALPPVPAGLSSLKIVGDTDRRTGHACCLVSGLLSTTRAAGVASSQQGELKGCAGSYNPLG